LTYRGHAIEELCGHDEMPGRGDVDAVRERWSGKVRVEQRNDAAGPGDAEPDRHVLGAVRHQEADGFAFGDPLVDGPPRVPGGPVGERAVRQAFLIREQGRRISEFLRELLDNG